MNNGCSNNSYNYLLTACIHWRFKLSARSIIGYCDVTNRRSLATAAYIQSGERMHWRERQNQMEPAIVSKWGFLAFVLPVLKGRNGYRVIIRIETGTPRLNTLASARIRGPKHDTRCEWPVLILQFNPSNVSPVCMLHPNLVITVNEDC